MNSPRTRFQPWRWDLGLGNPYGVGGLRYRISSVTGLGVVGSREMKGRGGFHVKTTGVVSSTCKNPINVWNSNIKRSSHCHFLNNQVFLFSSAPVLWTTDSIYWGPLSSKRNSMYPFGEMRGYRNSQEPWVLIQVSSFHGRLARHSLLEQRSKIGTGDKHLEIFRL